MNPSPITCLLYLSLLLVVSEAFSLIPHKAHVVIYNDLGSGTDLTVHCKSKNDDLGEQRFGYQNSFEFGFRPSIFMNTLFYCSFQWDATTHWFDRYVEMRDKALCSQCVWNVKPDGPCLTNYDVCFPWNA